jgi:hypothetical protein
VDRIAFNMDDRLKGKIRWTKYKEIRKEEDDRQDRTGQDRQED